MSKPPELTDEAKLLGEFYAWIHRRAEWLRHQAAATESNRKTTPKITRGANPDTPASYTNPVETSNE
jgi:hypothetical protein